MADLKTLKPVDFVTVPQKSGCTGCVFLDATTDARICKITRDLDLMDLAIQIDAHFGVSCLKNKIIYKIKGL
jgi:hypothetical protein